MSPTSTPPAAPSRRRFLGSAVAACVLPRAARANELPRSAGPYVPTPQVIVERMLEFARVSAADYVVDLGSGDGRMVRTAAKLYGASGFGVDIDGELVDKSNAEAQREGLAERVAFYQRDVLNADIRKATVVTLYVLPEMMLGLRPKMLAELRPGTRIVSHDYHFREWQPDSRWSFDVPEKREAVGFSATTIYLWIVPAQVGGRWRMQVASPAEATPVVLDLHQDFQRVRGTARIGSRSIELANVRLRGDALEFTLEAADPQAELGTYYGKVAGDAIEGEVASGPGPLARRYRWKAARIAPPAEPFAR